MKQALALLLCATVGLAQNPVSIPDNSGNRVLPGDTTNRAIRVVCVNPATQVLQSCAGSGGTGGGDVNITEIGGNPVTTTIPVSVPGSVAVTGTFYQATQPVSAASLPLPTGAATSSNQTTANTSLSSIDGKLPVLSGGRVPVDGSGVTQPVSGTVTANAGSGTFAVSAASLPLPTGAATAAKQPAIGTAGTASTDVITVQGISGGTSLNVVCTSGCTPGGSFNDNSSFTFGTTAVNVAGYVFDDASPNAVTENNAAAPRMSGNRVPYAILRDAAGNERGANVTAGNALLVDASATTQPISAVSLPLPTGAATSANQTTANSSLANIETYTSRIPALGQALAAASVPVVLTAAQLSTLTPLSTVAVTQSTSPWVVSNGGTFAVQAAQSGTWNIGSITTLPSIPAGTNNIGDVDVLTVPADPFGANADAASATGSISAKLRYIAATGIPVTSLPSVTIGTFPDNEPFNVAQINGVAPSMGNGASGTGVQRVTIANDSTGVLATVSTVTNLSQLGGQAIAMGTGTRSAGTQRVTVATDDVVPTNPSTAANWGIAATGAAPPANAVYAGVLSSGATSGLLRGQVYCDQTASFNGTASAQVIAGVSGRKIYICRAGIHTPGGANTVSIVSGTGSVCATGITAIPGLDGATTAANGFSFQQYSGDEISADTPLAITANNADNVCVLVGSATRVIVMFKYAIL